jgi:hypothetical protein
MICKKKVAAGAAGPPGERREARVAPPSEKLLALAMERSISTNMLCINLMLMAAALCHR